MNLPRRSRAALPAVCLALAATPCFAQTAPAAQPPPAPTGAPAEPPAAPPTPAPAPAPVWETPAPLPEGARVQRPPPPRFDVEPGPARGFPGAARECPDTQRAGRIVAETLAASAVTTASVLVGMFAQDASGSGQQALGTLGALVMYITVTPAAVGLVGRTFGGNGRYWAALLGGVLLPVAGATCSAARGGARARGAGGGAQPRGRGRRDRGAHDHLLTPVGPRARIDHGTRARRLARAPNGTS
jgi:hypothetical protein